MYDQGFLLFLYLGVQIFVGLISHNSFQPLVHKIRNKLTFWKGKLFSMMKEFS